MDQNHDRLNATKITIVVALHNESRRNQRFDAIAPNSTCFGNWDRYFSGF